MKSKDIFVRKGRRKFRIGQVVCRFTVYCNPDETPEYGKIVAFTFYDDAWNWAYSFEHQPGGMWPEHCLRALTQKESKG